MSTEEAESLKVYVILKDVALERFREVKNYMGVTNDTDVFRFLVSWFWQHEVKTVESE